MSELCFYDSKRRFGGVDRLYGLGFTTFLSQRVHVMVVGVGGVGSWVVEALARSAVGEITLVDLDQVAESNINRQIQAVDLTLGKAKVVALAERVHTYSPHTIVNAIEDFLEESNSRGMIAALVEGAKVNEKTVVVVDCCDNARAKVAMAYLCRRNKIIFAMSGGAGGKSKPWLVQPCDLRDTVNDPLLAKVRYQLRKDYSFSKTRKMAVQTFYSTEQVTRSGEEAPEGGLNCAGYGSVVTVTAAMGMQMGAWVLNKLHAKFIGVQQED
jgi:tRNA A37 threonylcarbamoyladenosine dehydratase